MKGHFGADPLQCFGQEVGCSHPGFDGAEGMLDRLTPLAHLLRVLIKPLLDRFQKVFVLPPRDPSLLARGALMLDGACLASAGSVAAQAQAVLDIGVVEGQALTGRTDINIVVGHIAEVLLAKAAFRLGS